VARSHEQPPRDLANDRRVAPTAKQAFFTDTMVDSLVDKASHTCQHWLVMKLFHSSQLASLVAGSLGHV
jgi:hypothetical protein